MLLLLCKLHLSLGSLFDVKPSHENLEHLNESLRYQRLLGSSFEEKLSWYPGGTAARPISGLSGLFLSQPDAADYDDPKGALELSPLCGTILGPRMAHSSLLMGDLDGAIRALHPVIATAEGYLAHAQVESIMTQLMRTGLAQNEDVRWPRLVRPLRNECWRPRAVLSGLMRKRSGC